MSSISPESSAVEHNELDYMLRVVAEKGECIKECGNEVRDAGRRMIVDVTAGRRLEAGGQRQRK